MREAGNFLNAMAEGKTLAELRGHLSQQINARRRELDVLAAELVESGIALWGPRPPTRA